MTQLWLPDGVKQQAQRKRSTKSWIAHNAPPGFVDAFKRQRAPDVHRLLKEYERVVFACAGINARGVGDTRLRLYAKSNNGQRVRHWRNAPVKKSHEHFLRNKANLTIRTDDTLREVTDDSHPFWRMWQSAGSCLFLENTQTILELVGLTYWHRPIHPTLGIPSSLSMLQVQWVEVIKNKEGRPVRYDVTTPDGTKKIPAADVVVINFPDPTDINGQGGYSPLRAVWEDVNISNKMSGHFSSLLDNSARPDALISVKDGAGEEEAERMEWRLNNKFRRGGSGSILVADEEIEVKPIGWNPTDLSLLEFAKSNKVTVANAFNVPLSLLETEAVPRANFEAAMEFHAKNTVLPRLRRIETILNDHVVRLFDDRLFAAFDDPTPENADLAIRRGQAEAQVDTMLVSRVLTQNEIRVQRGFPPKPGGDELETITPAVESPAPDDDDSKPTTDTPEPTTDQEIQTAPELVLNGAQVTAATAIIGQVAQGLLPRDSALGQLQVMFNLSAEQAEQMMGSVGLDFTPAQEDQPAPEQRSLILPDNITHDKEFIPRGKAPKLPDGKELVPILVKHFRRQRNQILQTVTEKQFKTKQLPDEFVGVDEWSEDLANEVAPVVEIFFGGEGNALIQRVGASPGVFNVKNPHVQKIIDTITLQFAESTVATTTKELNDALAELRNELAEGVFDHGESIRQLTKRVQKVFENAETFRAQRIAKSEASRAHHEGLREAAKASGVVRGFKLLLSSDPCPLCIQRYREGSEVGLDGSFSVGQPPFDKQLIPIHPSCECGIEELLDIRA